ncbi:MAG: TRAP transporter substrate-binding protein DctP [Ectothiorhodospiraceae bacterium]|nr:TRAP transporter substrate-binding protein DctP [Ectothiorhodospiraceae bacterium]
MKAVPRSFFRVMVVAISALIFGLVAAVPASADTTTWRVQAHWPSASTSYTDSLKFLADRLEERTDGRLKLQLFEAGSLVPTSEIFSAVRRGVVEMGTGSPGYVLDRSELAGIAFGPPAAFRDVWEALYFFKNLGFEDMLHEEFLEQGVYWYTDKIIATEMVVKEPIESLDQFRGMNIRSSGTLQRFLTDAGAAASMIPGEELYQALATGVVDGAHWGAVQGALSMGLYETAGYHVRPALNYSGVDAFWINAEAMESLPDDIRDIVKQTLREQIYVRTIEYQYKEEVALARAMQEHGVQLNHLPDDVLAAMNEAASTTWDRERAKGDRAAEVMDMLEAMLRDLGHIE